MAFDLDTHRFLHWNMTHTPDGDNQDFHYIDIAAMLSQANRKTYRQGMSYDVANIVFHDSDTSETFFKVCTAPNSWPLQAAWQSGFLHWREQIDLAESSLEDNDALTGPWSDFKVFLNYDHKGDVDKAVFIDVEGNTLTGGDWDYSVYTTQTGGTTNVIDNVSICLMGPHQGDFTSGSGDTVSLLEVLENVIRTPTEDPLLPEAAADSLWSFMQPHATTPLVTEAVISRSEDENDVPPYHITTIPGAGTAGDGRPSDPWVIRECCIPGGGAHMAAVGGFTAPCGLICIETTQATNDDIIGVTLELVPGDYKGVSARPMRGGGF